MPPRVCTRWLTVVLITPKAFSADCTAVRLALEAANIEARPVWKPMHLQPVFKGVRLLSLNGQSQPVPRCCWI